MGEARRLRAHTSLTNREIAARLGVHPSTVGRWLKPHPAAALAAGRMPLELPGGDGVRSEIFEERSPE